MKISISFSQKSARNQWLKLWRRSKLVNIEIFIIAYHFKQVFDSYLFFFLECVELMVLGFISLLLTFSQYYIAKICIPDSIADTMLPCPPRNKSQKDGKGGEVSHRLLLWYQEGRSLAESSSSSCKTVIVKFYYETVTNSYSILISQILMLM